MADDNDFDQIVGKIRDALTIPTYGLTDFYGSDENFEIFNETNSDGESSLSPYAGEKGESLYHMDTVKDRYPEAVNLTNWRNLSFVHTYYNYFNNNNMKGNRLPLEIQGVSDSVVSSLSGAFNLEWMQKTKWVEHLNTYLLKTKGTTGEKADNYFLFFPDAEPEIAPQGISFPANYFAIMCLRWERHYHAAGEGEWIYEAWWFNTPSRQRLRRPNQELEFQIYDSATQRFFCENNFPLRNFIYSEKDYYYASDYWNEVSTEGFGEWEEGNAWTVNGGGFYLGQDAKPFLDLFPKNKPDYTTLGVFNWWW